MTIHDAIRLVIDTTAGMYDTREAEGIALLILEYSGFRRKDLFSERNRELAKDQEMLLRRISLELKSSRPIQYILGETEFCGMKFRVDEKVLVPRPETEELVYRILKENHTDIHRILDLGTGSGCMAISLARLFPQAHVTATDISAGALKIAAENAKLNHTEIEFVQADMLNPSEWHTEPFDLIISNPPYVPESDRKFMSNNVLLFEPPAALFVPDSDPLVYYRAIAEIARERLNSGKFLYVETHEKFAPDVAALFTGEGCIKAGIHEDIHGKQRFVSCMKR